MGPFLTGPRGNTPTSPPSQWACRGQSYDNGSDMRGIHQGVQKRVLDVNEKALFMPCSSHTLNLVILDGAKSSILSVTFFSTLQRIYTIFSSSTQRWAVLKEHVTTLTVKQLSDTRWECRVESVKVLRYQLNEVVAALKALVTYAAEKKDGTTTSEAESLLKQINSWQFVICLVVWYDVLYQINRISKLFQCPQIDIAVLKLEIQAVETYLQTYREKGYSSAKVDARELVETAHITMEFPQVRSRARNASLTMSQQMML